MEKGDSCSNSRFASKRIACCQRLTKPSWGLRRTRKVDGRDAFQRRNAAARAQVTEGRPASADEETAWRRRQEESKQAAEEEGRLVGDSDHWRWTLNWDGITPEIVVGSCPRSGGDIDTLADKAGITAIVNLQSDICFDALQIPFPEIKQRAVERGVFLARVPVRDFDHGDQAAMLPEAVRVVNLLVHRGHRVYVHCTAGINRAPLVALAYLYFIQGLRRDEALRLVKTARSIANPYLDCLTEAKRRLLEGRDEELTALATEIYEQRCRGECRGDASSDWSGAQARALSRSFSKYLEVDLGLLDTEREIFERVRQLELAEPVVLPEDMQVQLDAAKAMVEQQRARIAQVKSLVEQWEGEAADATAKAEELEAALKRKIQEEVQAKASAETLVAGSQASERAPATNGKPGGRVTNGAAGGVKLDVASPGAGSVPTANGRAAAGTALADVKLPQSAAVAKAGGKAGPAAASRAIGASTETKTSPVHADKPLAKDVGAADEDDDYGPDGTECDVITRTCSDPMRED